MQTEWMGDMRVAFKDANYEATVTYHNQYIHSQKHANYIVSINPCNHSTLYKNRYTFFLNNH